MKQFDFNFIALFALAVTIAAYASISKQLKVIEE